MPDEEDFEITPDQIARDAAGPIRVTGDEGTVQKRKMQDMIDGDRYAAEKKAAKSGAPFGLRMTRINFPGME